MIFALPSMVSMSSSCHLIELRLVSPSLVRNERNVLGPSVIVHPVMGARAGSQGVPRASPWEGPFDPWRKKKAPYGASEVKRTLTRVNPYASPGSGEGAAPGLTTGSLFLGSPFFLLASCSRIAASRCAALILSLISLAFAFSAFIDGI